MTLVTVKANISCLGLADGQTDDLELDDVVQAHIDAERLSLVTEAPADPPATVSLGLPGLTSFGHIPVTALGAPGGPEGDGQE